MTESLVRRWMCAVVAVALAFGMLAGSANVGGTTMSVNTVMGGNTPCPTVPIPGPGPKPGTRGSDLPIVMNPCPGYEWAKTFGVAGAYDMASGLDVTSDGGAVLLVFTQFVGATVVKMDGEGTVQWQKNFNNGNTGPGDITHTSDGGFALAVTGDQPTEAGYNVYRLDAIGDVIWRVSFDGAGDDRVHSIAETADGGFVLSGQTNSFGAGGYDLWVLRLDSVGGLVWQRTYGGPFDQWARAGALPTPDGGFIAAGFSDFADNIGGAWVIKMDSSGNVVWQKRYRPTSGGVNSLDSIQPTSDGGYIMSGMINSKWWVVKLTAAGAVTWQKTYGDALAFGSIIQTADGGYLGSTRLSFDPSRGADLGLLRLDSAGNRLWQRSYGGFSAEYGCNPHCVREAADGNFIVAGATSSYGTLGGSSEWDNRDGWVLRVFTDGTISSTCDPSFGTTLGKPNVSGPKMRVDAPSFTSSATGVEQTYPASTTSQGTLVTMTQCAA